MNVPTNGRQVLYFPCDGPTDRVLDRTQPRPATICYVHGPECVNLAVLDQNGNIHSRSSVKLYPPSFVMPEGPTKESGGFAMWPARPELPGVSKAFPGGSIPVSTRVLVNQKRGTVSESSGYKGTIKFDDGEVLQCDFDVLRQFKNLVLLDEHPPEKPEPGNTDEGTPPDLR